MNLLTKRDLTYLVRTMGESEADSDVPKRLQRVHFVHPELSPQERVNPRDKDEDFLVIGVGDYLPMLEHTRELRDSALLLPAIWSGYRSTLVHDGSQGLYRIKGCSLNPFKPQAQELDKHEVQVFGAQIKFAAEFEKKMSDKFNTVLRNEGINPVMQCKGYWNYPKKGAGEKLAASLVKIEGDTRLDEMMFLMENLFVARVQGKTNISSDARKLLENMAALYDDMGHLVGMQKRLMDRNMQTWSADGGRSNAHIGNIVLYNGNGTVKLGFVDFDASCDTDDFSQSKLKAMQKREYDTLITSSTAGIPISTRLMAPNPKQFWIRSVNGKPQFDAASIPALKERFITGFKQGYESSLKIVSNQIPYERFLEVFQALRSAQLLELVVSKSLESLLKGYGKMYGREVIYNSDNDILRRNNKFQKDILKPYKDNNDESLIYKKDKDDDYGLESYFKKDKKNRIYSMLSSYR